MESSSVSSALMVSCSKKNIILFSEALNIVSIKQITVINSAAEARRTLLDNDFDLALIDAPLGDESGESLARYIAEKNLSQVILFVNAEHFNATASACEADGILTISKPVNHDVFWPALSLAKSAGSKLKRIQAENAKLKQKIEDIRIIDRAKLLLISHLNLSEQEAHRLMEKQAMDLRSSKRTIAQEIIKTYAN